MQESTVAVACAVIAVAVFLGFFLGWLIGVVSRWLKSRGADLREADAAVSAQAVTEPESTDRRPHLQATFLPSTGVIRSNTEAYAFENENCTGKVFPLHRATYDKKLDASGNYPYGEHFVGKKRVWEVRMQFRFKVAPTQPLLFGIELEDYVPMNGTSKRIMSATVAALRRVVGNDLYHSPGDDPKVVMGPNEKPVFMMPLWAFDQFVVTQEGEEAPDMRSADFPSMGMSRAANRHAFIKAMSALDLRVGPTYTFAFWGISQFLDVINWELQGIIPFTRINFNQFCGAPPVHVSLYTLKDDGEEGAGERRHLESRKNYYFRLAFWSSEHKPSKERLACLLPGGDEAGESSCGGEFRRGSTSRSGTHAGRRRSARGEKRASGMSSLGALCSGVCMWETPSAQLPR